MKYSKNIIYSIIFIVTTFGSGIAVAQIRTEVDIIPTVRFFEDDQLISFSAEELENFNKFVLEPLSLDIVLSTPDTTSTSSTTTSSTTTSTTTTTTTSTTTSFTTSIPADSDDDSDDADELDDDDSDDADGD